MSALSKFVKYYFVKKSLFFFLSEKSVFVYFFTYKRKKKIKTTMWCHFFFLEYRLDTLLEACPTLSLSN